MKAYLKFMESDDRRNSYRKEYGNDNKVRINL